MRIRILIPRRGPRKLVARSAKRSGPMALIIGMAALVGTLYALFGDSGLMAVMQMRARASHLRYEIAAKERDNRELWDVIRPLQQNDPAAIEKLARETQYMVRPGETLYLLLPEKPAAQDSEPPRTEPGSPTAPSLPRWR